MYSLPAARIWKISAALWILFAVIAATVVAVEPDRRSATIEYQRASAKWWASEAGVYREKNGYLYLPQAAMIYTPFELLPDRIGEPLWRVVILALLAFALLVAAKKLSPSHAALVFLVATALVIPSALSNARNGQVNMPLGALYLLSAIAIADRRWWLTAALLTVSLALKPISIVPILLGAALFPKLILPLATGLCILFAAAFLHPSPEYVWGQYREFVECLLRAGRPTSDTWCDFAGMFRRLGLQLPDAVTLGIRALFAPLTLWVCWVALKGRDPLRGAFLVMTLASVYLMLFNPRTETNSYVIMGTFVALFGACAGVVNRNTTQAAWFVLLAAIFGTENYGMITWPWTNLWLKALATIVFAVWLTAKIFQPAPAAGDPCNQKDFWRRTH